MNYAYFRDMMGIERKAEYMLHATRKNGANVLLYSLVFLLFSSINLVNHYNFRTWAYDLGIFNHAMYDYSRFQFNQPTLILTFSNISNLLADHFSILHIFFSPLRYIFGTYTLLILQNFILLYGAWGIRRYVSLFTRDGVIPYLAQIHFFLSFGVIAAVGYDYHDSVLGAMFVPHLLYYARLKRIRQVVFLSILIVFSRVELSVWLFFILLALILVQWKDNKMRIRLSQIAFFSLLYFIIITNYVIPAISPEGYVQFSFSAIGDHMGEALVFSITHPFETLSYLFKSQHGTEEDFLIKLDFYMAFLMTGGFLMIFRPALILMLFPVIVQRMLHDSTLKWGITGHYSIESMVLLSMAAFSTLAFFSRPEYRRGIGIFLIISAAYTTFYFWEYRHPEWVDTTTENFTDPYHYKNDFDVKEMHRLLHTIPDESVVSAQSAFVPHLAFRDKIYLFPYLDDAEYVVLNERSNIYPLNREKYEEMIQELKEHKDWKMIYHKNHAFVFRKELKSYLK